MTLLDSLNPFRETSSLHKYFSLCLLFLILLLFSASLCFLESKFLILLDNFINVLFFLLFLIIPGFYFLKLLNRRYFTNNIAILLSYPTSIIVFGLIWIVLQTLNSPPFAYALINGCFVIVILSLACKKKLLPKIFKIDEIYKYGLLLVLIGALIAVSFVSVDTENPKLEVRVSSISKSHSMPHDNRLQYRTAKVFLNKEAPWTDNFWTMGDRPPLMGVINSIWAFSTLNFKHYTSWYFEIVGIVLNILFILPCAVISKRIFNNPKVFYIVPVAIFLNIFIFLNIYYTWPKLMGAFFPLASVVLLLIKKRIGYLTMFIVGILWSLAALAHPGAMLSFPVLFLFYFIFSFKLNKLKYIIPFFVSFLLLQTPWIIYKKHHPKIDTNNLVILFIPSENFPDNPIKTISNFLKEYPVKKQLEHRFNRIKEFIKRNNIFGAPGSLFSGNLKKYYKNLYKREFFNPAVAMGELQILLCIPILMYFFISYFFKHKKISPSLNIRLLSFFFFFIILSYAFNVFIKWKDSYNHTLPYVELIFGIMIFSGISFSLNKSIRILSFSFIIIRFIYYLINSPLSYKFQFFDIFNILVVLGVIVTICLSQFYIRRHQELL